MVTLDVDDANPGPISIRLPDGVVATRGWFVSAALPGPHEFGLRRLAASVATGRRIVHVSDVHIGRTVSEVDANAFKEFAWQLSQHSDPGDLFAVTGDNSHTGSVTDTLLLAESLRTIENPTAPVMGNHDEGNGPDFGRLYQQFVAPGYYTMEWSGFLVISLPRLEGGPKARKWFKDTVAASTRKCIVLVHDLPERVSLSRLDKDKVVAILSGHWHADQVSSGGGSSLSTALPLPLGVGTSPLDPLDCLSSQTVPSFMPKRCHSRSSRFCRQSLLAPTSSSATCWGEETKKLGLAAEPWRRSGSSPGEGKPRRPKRDSYAEPQHRSSWILYPRTVLQVPDRFRLQNPSRPAHNGQPLCPAMSSWQAPGWPGHPSSFLTGTAAPTAGPAASAHWTLTTVA